MRERKISESDDVDLNSEVPRAFEPTVTGNEMALNVSHDGCAFEWAGKCLATVSMFCQTSRLVDLQPRCLRMSRLIC